MKPEKKPQNRPEMKLSGQKLKPAAQLKRLLFRQRGIEADTQLKRMTRADERPLLWLVMAFEFLSLLLLAFKNEEMDAFSLRTAVVLPLCTFLGYQLMVRRYHADRVLFILTALLCGLGVILLRAVFTKSASAEKQLTLLLAVMPMLLIGMQVPRVLSGSERVIDFAMLPAAAFMGLSFVFSTGSDARSWVRIGSSLQLQPSEILKPVMIVILSAGFTRWGDLKSNIPYAGFAAGMCALLVAQPDLGAVFLYFILTLALFAVGTGRRRTALFTLLIALAAAAVFVALNRQTGWFEYLNARIDLFLDPWTDELNTSRQIAQGLMSIASGGLFGSGLGLSSASRVAVVESDYIFAAAAEEYGTIFTLCLIGVYIVIMLRGMLAAQNARSRFHALLAFGSAFQLTTQAALIILGNLNIIPLTGVTLPFVSSGGSSLIGSSLMMGLILGVSSVNAEDEYDDLMRITKGAPVT